jgi:hypothetical protein
MDACLRSLNQSTIWTPAPVFGRGLSFGRHPARDRNQPRTASPVAPGRAAASVDILRHPANASRRTPTASPSRQPRREGEAEKPIGEMHLHGERDKRESGDDGHAQRSHRRLLQLRADPSPCPPYQLRLASQPAPPSLPLPRARRATTTTRRPPAPHITRAGGRKGVAPPLSLRDYVHQHKTEFSFSDVGRNRFDFKFEILIFDSRKVGDLKFSSCRVLCFVSVGCMVCERGRRGWTLGFRS